MMKLNLATAALTALLSTAAAAQSDAGMPPAAPDTAATGPGNRLPSPELSVARIADGDRLMQERRYREAAFAYLDAVHADPESVEAAFKLANAYAVLGYYDAAISQWNVAAERSTDPAVRKSVQDNVAKARAKLEQQGGGTPQLQGKGPGDGPVADATKDRARAAYEQGVQQINSKDYPAAVQSLATAIQLEPTLSVAYIARGSALIGLRRYGEAVLDYQYAQKLAPTQSSPLYGLAEAYRGLGRIPEAKALYRRYLDSTAADVRAPLQDDARRKLEKL